MRNNRFIVNIPLPEYLRDNRTQYGVEDALLSLRCESVQLPGMNLTTVDMPRIGIGPVESMAHNLTYGDITTTFLVDANSKIHRIFYDWMNTIINFQGSQGQSTLNREYTLGSFKSYAYEVGFKDSYRTNLVIDVYDNYGTAAEEPSNAESTVANPVMRVRMFNCFPKAVPNIDLSWGVNDELVRLSIPWSFTDFDVAYPATGNSSAAGGVLKTPVPKFNQKTGKPSTPKDPPKESKVPKPGTLNPTEKLGVNRKGQIEVKDLNRFTQEMRNGK